MEPASSDQVILVDEAGRAVGLAPRATVHGQDTPLHLAFSCYVYRDDGELLVTRRALAKRTWPGVWTNAFCGHPRLDEGTVAAVHRHARHELGLAVEDVRCVLPDFRYRAVDASGVVENEICPVFVARAASGLEPNPEEVMDHRWVGPARLRLWVDLVPFTVSPWMTGQLAGVLEALEA